VVAPVATDEVVVVEGRAVGEAHLSCVDVDRHGPAVAEHHVVLAAEDGANGIGDVGRVEPGRCHLVEQRLEGVEVVAVDDRHLHRLAPEMPDGAEPCEAGPDHHHAVHVLRMTRSAEAHLPDFDGPEACGAAFRVVQVSRRVGLLECSGLGQGACCGDDVFDLGEDGVLQGWLVSDEGVLGGDAYDGRVEVQKQCCATQAATSAPNPAVRVSSWTTARRPVRCTDSHTMSWSHGEMVRRSTTSTEHPSPESSSAATSDFCTVAPQVAMVRSRPCRATVPRPKGNTHPGRGMGSAA